MSPSATSNPAWNAATNAEEVAAALSSSIAGKTVLVTGVSPGGLGAHFLKVIAPYGPKLLILAGRSLAKCAETAKELEAARPGITTRTLELDLSSQAQVRKAAAEVLSWPEPIDVLVNNAAVMATPYEKTVDGLELQFGTNHIGHFLFTNLIMPKLLASPNGPRVVNVSSGGHRFSDIRWDDLGFQDGKAYNKWGAYAQSKTANILFSVGLAQRLGPKGLKAFAIHPGFIMTNICRSIESDEVAGLKALDRELGNREGDEGYQLIPKNFSQGTATYVVAAFDPKLEGHNGIYLQDCQPGPNYEDPFAEQLKPYAVDKNNAERLWVLSEELIGQKFDY